MCASYISLPTYIWKGTKQLPEYTQGCPGSVNDMGSTSNTPEMKKLIQKL